jgi:hypothetical protein
MTLDQLQSFLLWGAVLNYATLLVARRPGIPANFMFPRQATS